jgi:phosphoribosylaminoimidazole-succinocarboxamide synthase
VIPWKGQVLTQLARYWFEKTEDIAANHVMSYPDPNVVLGKKLTILPVEIVVRGYLAGTTSTSILTQYQKGQSADVWPPSARGAAPEPGTAAGDHHAHLQGLRRRP